MRVLHVINSLGLGGAEKLIVDSLPLYKEEGIDIELCILGNKNNVLLPMLEDSGIPIHISKHRNLYSVKNVFYLKRLFRDFDIVHLHLFPTLYWGVIANLISVRKVQIFYTEHNTNNRRRNSIFFKIVDSFIYSKLEYIGCISNAVKNSLLQHLPNLRTPLNVINNGIVLDDFININGEVEIDGIDSSMFKLIQVSSFTLQKDQKTVIKALNYLPKNVVLILVGDGPLRKECENYTRSLGLSDRVFFLGKRLDVPKLLKYSDIVILSSHFEGFGLAIVEGMVSYKPVIASDVPGLSDIVEGAGILFKCGDDVELKSKILNLYRDENLYEKISKSSFKKGISFDIKFMVKEYLNVYKDSFSRLL